MGVMALVPVEPRPRASLEPHVELFRCELWAFEPREWRLTHKLTGESVVLPSLEAGLEWEFVVDEEGMGFVYSAPDYERVVSVEELAFKNTTYISEADGSRLVLRSRPGRRAVKMWWSQLVTDHQKAKLVVECDRFRTWVELNAARFEIGFPGGHSMWNLPLLTGALHFNSEFEKEAVGQWPVQGSR